MECHGRFHSPSEAPVFSIGGKSTMYSLPPRGFCGAFCRRQSEPEPRIEEKSCL